MVVSAVRIDRKVKGEADNESVFTILDGPPWKTHSDLARRTYSHGREEERLLSSRAFALPKALRERRLGPAVMVGPRTRASCLGLSSAGQAGETGRRVPAAVRALHRELCWGQAEDSGQPLN